MVVPARFLGQQGMADWTAALVFLPEPAYPSWPVEVLQALVAQTLVDIEFPSRVVRMRCLLEVHMPLEPPLRGVKQGVALLLHLTCKHGLASLVRPTIADGQPARAFVAMAAFGPVAECVADRAIAPGAGWPTTAVTIRQRPAAQERVAPAQEDTCGRRRVGPNAAPALRAEPLAALCGRGEAPIPVIRAKSLTEKVASGCARGERGLLWREREAACAEKLLDAGAAFRCPQGSGAARHKAVIRLSDQMDGGRAASAGLRHGGLSATVEAIQGERGEAGRADAALGRATVSGREGVLCQGARLQPCAPAAVVPRDMGQEPGLAEAVQTGLAGACEAPGGGVRGVEDERALAQGVRRGPGRADARGVRLGCGRGHGGQGQEGEGLHGAGVHRGDAQGAPRAVTLGTRHASQWTGMRAPASPRVDGPRLLSWGGPCLPSPPWGPVAVLFRHPSAGQGLTAERVGEEMGHGVDRAPSAHLRCLHETGLEPTHVPVDRVPVALGPGPRGVGGRPSSACRGHVLALRERCAQRARAESPDGRLLAGAWGEGATPLHPMTAWLSLLPSSCPSWGIAVTDAAVTPRGDTHRLTTVRLLARVG
jgi:hypothetical protein